MANEADGWHVAGWSGTNDDSSQSSTNIVTMPNSDHTVGVSYEADCYTLTLNVSPNNSGNVTPTPPKSASCPANLQYTTGASVSLRAMANTGYEFSGWSGALSGATNPQSLTMDGNKSVTANFSADCYTLMVTIDPSSIGIGTLGKDRNPDSFTGAVRQHGSATHHLIGLARIDTQVDGDIHRFPKLGAGQLLEQIQGFFSRIKLTGGQFGADRLQPLGELSHDL